MIPSNVVRTREKSLALWSRADALLDIQMLEVMRGKRNEVDWKLIEEVQTAAVIVNSLAVRLYQDWNKRGCVEFMPQIVKRLTDAALSRPDWDSIEYVQP